MKAQFIEDALRYTQSNALLTPRVAGLNVAFHGISDDIGALLFNPAGLSQSGRSELSFGFGFTRNSTETDFLNNLNIMKTNNEIISHAGIIAPFDAGTRKAAVGIGYFRENDFQDNFRFNGFNKYSTFIDNQARFGSRNFDDNMATFLSLANNQFKTPITDSLNQSGIVQEKGGMHNITGGAAFDVSESVALGFSISGKWGSYDFSREFEEFDTYNKYNFFDEQNYTNIDFRRLIVNESLRQDVSGITGSVGVQGRIGNFMRLGATVKFPTFFKVDEEFSQEARAEFDNGDATINPYMSSGKNSYNITLPFVYSGGISVNALGLVFAAGVEYTDNSQIEFSDGPDKIENMNLIILQNLVGQTKFGFGAEYNLPELPIVARASLSITTSPYSTDIANAALKTVSLGGGLYLASNLRLDFVMRFNSNSESRTNYSSGNGSNYIINKAPMNLGFQITYRY